MLSFAVLAEEGHARRGRLTLRRGTVETPVFMPVGCAPQKFNLVSVRRRC
jgi:tRNA-guanine family transglycosylase